MLQQSSNMDLHGVNKPNMNKTSWESLSSAYSNLEVSISQDSSYASDEVSVTSNIPSTAATSVVSSVASASDSSSRPYLKSILKNSSTTQEEDSESESGYGTDGSDYVYDDLSEDGDMYEVEVWDDGSDAISEIFDHDDNESIDASFIAFEVEPTVRFDTNVHYIEAPEFAEDDSPETEMTCHELMEIARNSGSLQLMEAESPEADLNDGDESHKDGPVLDRPEEHTRDVVDLDKRLFVAYVNGINGIADPQYKSNLRARMDDMRQCRAESRPTETNGVYLDHVLSHVVGVFRNLVGKDEFDELVTISRGKGPGQSTSPEHDEDRNRDLSHKIENLLSERLAEGHEVGEDAMSFLAGGVACALEKGINPMH